MRFATLMTLSCCLLLPSAVGPTVARAGRGSFASPDPAATGQPYAVADLGTLGGPVSRASAINNAGQVVGFSQLGGRTPAPSVRPGASQPVHAFLWQPGTMTDLGTLGGANSFAVDLNDTGQVVGAAENPAGDLHAVRWDHGAIADLGTLGGDASQAVRINASGQIVGLSTTAPGQRLGDPGTHAVLWDRGRVTDLGTLGGTTSRANAINDAGRIVGAAENAAGEPRAVSWQTGTRSNLGSLPGFSGSAAVDLNGNGQVVGWVEDAGGAAGSRAGAPPQRQHAVLWNHGTPTDLGTLGGARSQAFGLNTADQVVGLSEPAAGADAPHAIGPTDAPVGPHEHAFLWASGTMTDLNGQLAAGSAWDLIGAGGINRDGRIVGSGLTKGHEHAVLLPPQDAGATPARGTPLPSGSA